MTVSVKQRYGVPSFLTPIRLGYDSPPLPRRGPRTFRPFCPTDDSTRCVQKSWKVESVVADVRHEKGDHARRGWRSRYTKIDGLSERVTTDGREVPVSSAWPYASIPDGRRMLVSAPDCNPAGISSPTVIMAKNRPELLARRSMSEALLLQAFRLDHLSVHTCEQSRHSSMHWDAVWGGE